MGNQDIVKYQGPDQGGAPFSRRSFIEVAIGTIAALPVVSAGTLALPFTRDEAHGLDATIKLANIKRNQAAIAVVDMTGFKRAPLSGAHVKLKSCFNGKVVEGDTDATGSVILTIDALAEDEGKKAKPVRYEFDAEVEVTKSGYRVFRTGRMRIKGARGIAAPTRKLEAGVAYPARVTFDDWDVLYTDNEFCVTAKNDMRHIVQVDLEGVSNSGAVKVMLYAADKEIASATANPSGSSCKVELQEHFLLKSAKKVLPVGANYSIRYEQNGKRFSAPIALKTSAAAGGFEAPGVNRNFTLSPFSEAKAGPTSHKGLQVTIPKGCPLIGGLQVQLWKPEFNNLDFGFDPFGFAYISFRTSDYGYKSKNGERVGDKNWQAHPKKSFSDQYNTVFNDAAENTVKTLLAIDQRTGKLSSVDLCRMFSATVMAQISLAAKWGEKQEGLFRVRAGGQVIFSLDFSLAWQFLAGPVPMVFQFGLNASFALGLNIAASTTKLFEWSQYQIDYTNSSLSFTIDISPSISLGVGIKGALSVSVKGVLTLTLFIAMTRLPDGRPKDVENPHRVVGLAANTFVVIQFLFFTIPFKLPFSINEPSLYDNWKGGYKSDYAAPEVSAQEGENAISFEQLIEEGFASGEAYILQEADFKEYLETEYGDNGEYTFICEPLEGGEETGAVETDYSLIEQDYTYEESSDGVIWLTETSASASDDSTVGMVHFSETALSGQSSSELSGQDEDSLMAATSPALEADNLAVQTAPPPPPDNKVGEERVYLNKGHSVVEQIVAGLASRTGLKPSATEIYKKDAVGDPHVKTVSIFGREFIFRIGVVTVIDQGSVKHTATRILCEGNFGDGKRYDYVFDYDARGININRYAYFDYDYDLAVREEGNVANLHFFVISGRRRTDKANKEAIGYYASEQVVAYVHYKLDSTTKKATCVVSMGLKTDAKLLNAARGDNTFKYHNISCPQISYIEDTVVEDRTPVTRNAFVMSYLDRAAATPEKILSQKEGEVRVGFGMLFFDTAQKRLTFCSTSAINDKIFNVLRDYSVFEVSLSKRYSSDNKRGVGWHVAMLKGGSHTYYYLVETGACGIFLNGRGYTAGSERTPKFLGYYDSDTEASLDLSNPGTFGPSRLVEWPNHEGFLASVKNKLVHVTLKNMTVPSGGDTREKVPNAQFAFTECGPENFSVHAFGVDNNGRFLYYPAVREGVPGYKYDASGNGTAKKAIEEHDVMACKLYGDKFSDPFVFCEVEYDMDTLVALSPQKSIAMSFLSSNLVDAKKSRAEIRYTAMPFVRCANVIGFSALSDFAFPGVNALFNITVRNDGNVHLAGCTIRLRRRGVAKSNKDTLTKIVFSKTNLVESNFNPAKEDGTLSGVLPDYSLAPGKTSVYQVELPIPDDWNGTTAASVTAEAFIAAAGSSGASTHSLDAQSDDELAAQADELQSQEYDEDGNQYADYIVSEGDYEDDELDYPYDDIEIWYDDELPVDGLSDAPVGDGDQEYGFGDYSAGGSQVPKLNDSAGNLDLIAMAAAGAGAAFAAYSNRRVQNEREAAATEEAAQNDDEL